MEDRKTLVEPTKIGEFLTFGCEMEGDEVAIFLASADVSASCGFKFEEWTNFVEAVNRADEAFRAG